MPPRRPSRLAALLMLLVALSAFGDGSPAHNNMLSTGLTAIPAESCDVGIIRIVYPQSYHDTMETITPTFVVRNYHASDTASFRAWMQLTDPYTDTLVYDEMMTVAGLAGGTDTALEFPDINFGHDSGSWFCYCSTYTDGDTNPSNDVMSKGFIVGNVSI